MFLGCEDVFPAVLYNHSTLLLCLHQPGVSLSSLAFDSAHSCLLHEAFLASCRESLVKQGALCVYVNMCVLAQSLQSCLTL